MQGTQTSHTRGVWKTVMSSRVVHGTSWSGKHSSFGYDVHLVLRPLSSRIVTDRRLYVSHACIQLHVFPRLHWLHVFLCLHPVTRFPALHSLHIFPRCTRYTYFGACIQQLHVFPRLHPVTCFPPHVPGYAFSRACIQSLVFSPFYPVYCSVQIGKTFNTQIVGFSFSAVMIKALMFTLFFLRPACSARPPAVLASSLCR